MGIGRSLTLPAWNWLWAENIQLQDLQDQNVVPKGYLKKQGIESRRLVNSIVNRTFISDDSCRDQQPALIGQHHSRPIDDE